MSETILKKILKIRKRIKKNVKKGFQAYLKNNIQIKKIVQTIQKKIKKWDLKKNKKREEIYSSLD